ncbi:phenylacetate--CoA ligase family protein [Pyrofollis japonicus]|uniref:phenylacetate--CoA ligase family protein n=1 Tax=Pyrofollis japonicus TaxID=3060460 RepID=UPI00295C0A55|nr:phenylacetate--CoA ligase [Pyrofollis japonicus]BEP16668.1 phenylacetate--CoA ligase family protein [Pyrofollis japonicus]
MPLKPYMLEPSIESAPREEIEKIQLARLRWTVKRAYENVPLYRRRMKEAGIGPDDIRSLEDVRKLPFTFKDDLRREYPFGLLAVPLSEVVEVHASSGTTGRPTVVAYTMRDIENWATLMARTLAAGGLGRGDVLYSTLNYHWFTGGLGFHYGAMRLGATVVPAGTGFTRRHVQMIRDLGATALAAVPNYAVRLAEVALEMGVDPSRDTKVRLGFFGAEMWSEEMRRRINKLWDMDSYDVYGMSELYGPGTASECHLHDGLHVWEDHYLVEVVDPKTGEPLGPEEEGVLVVTPLTHDAMPLLRYWTNDLTFIMDSKSCDCGRTMRRIARIKGRADDMLIVNGVNVFPQNIELAILQEPWASPHYQIIVERDDALDILRVVVESERKLSEEEKKEFARRLQEKLREVLIVKPRVEIVDPGTLPRTEGGKAKRIIDKRRG